MAQLLVASLILSWCLMPQTVLAQDRTFNPKREQSRTFKPQQDHTFKPKRLQSLPETPAKKPSQFKQTCAPSVISNPKRHVASLNSSGSSTPAAASLEALLNKIPFATVRDQTAAVRKTRIYRPFFLALAQIDFNARGPLTLRLPRYEMTYVLDPRIVAGWRTLGMIDAQGRFRFDFTIDEVLAKFQSLTGFKRVRGPHQILGDVEYLSYLARGEIFADDVHGLLFHLPYLLEPARREALSLGIEMLQLEDKWHISREMSRSGYRARLHMLFDLWFEGSAPNGQPQYSFLKPNQIVLYGPTQLEYHEPGVTRRDLDPARELEHLRSLAQQAEAFHFEKPVITLETDIEVEMMLRILSQELQNWQLALQFDRANRAQPTILPQRLVGHLGPIEQAMANDLVLAMRRSPMINQNEAGFLRQVRSLHHRIHEARERVMAPQ